MRYVLLFAEALVFIYLGICLFVYFYQKNLIFFPSKTMEEMPEGMSLEEVYFVTEDNVKLHAWYLDNQAKKTVLFFHGNAGNLSHRQKQLEVFDELKLNALIFDYREYGKSEGVIEKEEDLYVDARASLDYLIQERGMNEEDVIIWGRSLGGALAIDVAQERNVAAVIIESTFFSMDAMASRQFWFLPTKLLSKYHFQNDEKINNIDSKILIIHSLEDEVIPFENGKKLFEAANDPKNFLEISGDHNYGFSKSYNTYIKAIDTFFNNKNKHNTLPNIN